MVVYTSGSELERRERGGRENDVAATTIDTGQSKQGLRFRIMSIQNNGEEEQIGERAQK